MKGLTARLLFILMCVALSLLALYRVITPIITGVVFAIGLIVLGVASKGFQKR
jgi:hypothetical protein